MTGLIKNVRHFGIVVSDMEKSLKFYRDLLGLKVVRIMDESGNYIDNMLGLKKTQVKTVKLAANDNITLVELLDFKSHSKIRTERKIYEIGPTHIAFTVNSLDESYLALCKHGIKFNSPPQFSPDGKVRVTFCYDPDNTLVELVEVLDS